MFKKIEVQSNSLTRYIAELSEFGDVVSFFYEPNKEDVPYYNWKDDGWALLSYFLKATKDLEIGSVLERVYITKSKRYYILNQMELSGSLAENLLVGGVYGAPVETPVEARDFAYGVVSEVFPNKNWEFFAFKINSDDWCRWAKGGAIRWAYVSWDPKDNRLWFLAFGSTS